MTDLENVLNKRILSQLKLLRDNNKTFSILLTSTNSNINETINKKKFDCLYSDIKTYYGQELLIELLPINNLKTLSNYNLVILIEYNQLTSIHDLVKTFKNKCYIIYNDEHFQDIANPIPFFTDNRCYFIKFKYSLCKLCHSQMCSCTKWHYGSMNEKIFEIIDKFIISSTI